MNADDYAIDTPPAIHAEAPAEAGVPSRDPANLEEWHLIASRVPGFGFTVTHDRRGKPQVVTTGHPTHNGRKLSRKEMIAVAHGESGITLDPPGTRQANPPPKRQRPIALRVYAS
ncbi:hypothetical protein HYS28_03795 [Candidatus Uhrbacteria bacterium]|nr:hypothetical protein [Candidatus Uhrbacteria bacterium]